MGVSQATGDVQGGSPSHGLAELFGYPLLSAIAGRRTRRIAQDTSVDAGEASHTSANPPAPLTALEEAILIVSTGLTGFTMHDVPLTHPDGRPEFGTPLMRVPGRSASSPDNTQATHFILINGEGTWLIQQKRGADALRFLDPFPPRWEDWTADDWVTAASAVKRRLYSERLDFPRTWPYYFGWNKMISNRPGTTIFFPIVDCTRQAIDVLFILLSEPDGQRPLSVDDWLKFRPWSVTEWLAWGASLLGLVPKITYQPVAGIDRVRSGFLNRAYPVPLGLASTMRTDYEAFFHLQNLMLVVHSMGLGGWIHAAVGAPYVFERDPAQGKFVLGFRLQESKSWRRWPPLPSPLPNPIGIDGVLEGLCPPYVKSMNDAVDQVNEEKYGSRGMYGDAAVFARSYSSAGTAGDFLRRAERPGKVTVQYVKDICNYIWETYGRFPAHVNAFHVPGVWLQVSHLEIEYYRKFFSPGLYERQARHYEIWGRHS